MYLYCKDPGGNPPHPTPPPARIPSTKIIISLIDLLGKSEYLFFMEEALGAYKHISDTVLAKLSLCDSLLENSSYVSSSEESQADRLKTNLMEGLVTIGIELPDDNVDTNTGLLQQEYQGNIQEHQRLIQQEDFSVNTDYPSGL